MLATTFLQIIKQFHGALFYSTGGNLSSPKWEVLFKFENWTL
jgi:hypothetical protein